MTSYHISNKVNHTKKVGISSYFLPLIQIFFYWYFYFFSEILVAIMIFIFVFHHSIERDEILPIRFQVKTVKQLNLWFKSHLMQDSQ